MEVLKKWDMVVIDCFFGGKKGCFIIIRWRDVKREECVSLIVERWESLNL